MPSPSVYPLEQSEEGSSLPAGSERKVIMKKRIGSLLLAAVTVLALCFSTLAASAGTARRWQVYTERGSVYWKGAKAAEAGAKAPLWQPAWLPEGWALEHGSTRDGVWPETDWEYRRGEETLSVTVCAPSDLFFCHLMDHEAGGKMQKKTVKVQGYQADFLRVNQEAALLWEDNQGTLFVLLHSGALTQAELEKAANSFAKIDNPLPDFRLGWAPVQDRELRRSTTLPGYAEDYGGTPDFIRFEYAAQPLNAPAGTPEDVTVLGIPARLWLGDPKETGTLVRSSVSGKTAEIPTEKTWSTLIWTDPETGVCFRIKGNKLTKETMLRMAESVEPGKAPSWPAPASAAKVPASNAPAPVPSASGGPNASRRSWVADGWTASVTHADGTVERIPNFSELFPGQDLPRQR